MCADSKTVPLRLACRVCCPNRVICQSLAYNIIVFKLRALAMFEQKESQIGQVRPKSDVAYLVYYRAPTNHTAPIRDTSLDGSGQAPRAECNQMIEACACGMMNKPTADPRQDRLPVDSSAFLPLTCAAMAKLH